MPSWLSSPCGAHPPQGEAVAEQEVVGCGEGFGVVLVTGGVDAEAVAEPRGDPRLVQSDPGSNRIAERLVHQPRILREPLAGLPAGPAARVFQRLRQVPMVDREHRLDGPLAQPIHKPPVVVETFLIGGAAAVGLYPRPGDGEAVGLQAEARHEIQALFEAVVLVAGDVPGVAVQDVARRVGEGVPDGDAAPVLVHRAFDLIGGGCRTPQKAFGEVHALSSALVPYGSRVLAYNVSIEPGRGWERR